MNSFGTIEFKLSDDQAEVLLSLLPTRYSLKLGN